MGVHLDHLGPQHRDQEWRARLQRDNGGDGATALLLYLGRLSREKNLALLVDMVEGLLNSPKSNTHGHSAGLFSDYRPLIAGSGPQEGWLREQSARLGGRLHLLGHLNNPSEVARLLASVDVFVHPNPREPFGISPLEAMASGTPLVAPNAGGVLEYANVDCAWLAEPQGSAFARAVLEVLSNPVAAQAKVERARRVAERHNWQEVAGQFFDTYETFHALRLAAGERKSVATLPQTARVSNTVLALPS